MPSFAPDFNRKTAAEFLNVSLRTLDRFVQEKRLKSKKIGRFIRFSREDLEKVSFPATRLAQKTFPEIKEGPEESPPPIRESPTLFLTPHEQNIYQKLYEELRGEFKEQQKRLEGANYRVGHLEAQLKNAVPLLEFHKNQLEFKKLETGLKEENEGIKGKIKKTEQKLRKEKLDKLAYLILLFAILLLQPILWVLLQR